MKKIIVAICSLLLFIIAFSLGYYGYTANSLKGRFLYNTFINGVDCSLMTPTEADRALFDNFYPNEEVTLSFEDKTFELHKSDFDFSDTPGTVTLLNQVSSFKWAKSKFNETHFTLEDPTVLDNTISYINSNWEIFNEETWKSPKNAEIVYEDDKGFTIKAEETGTAINVDKVNEAIKYIIKTKDADTDISNYDGVYQLAEIKSNNNDLTKLLDKVKDFTNLKITYNDTGKTYDFSASDMYKYITFDYDKFEYNFDMENCTMDFMSTMASRLNTFGITRDFKTTKGDTVKVEGGDYGWWLNQKASAENLKKYITEHTNAIKTGNETTEKTGELVWLQTAVTTDTTGTTGGVDYKNYVEIDLTNQHLYMYKDGKLVVESDIVSGTAIPSRNTPGGTYSLTYKQRNATLRGPGYATPVSYWMPFNRDIGMHDATWRGSFGGTIYKNNGSHGCINLPLEAAKTIFENIDKDFAIICYWR